MLPYLLSPTCKVHLMHLMAVSLLKRYKQVQNQTDVQSSMVSFTLISMTKRGQSFEYLDFRRGDMILIAGVWESWLLQVPSSGN